MNLLIKLILLINLFYKIEMGNKPTRDEELRLKGRSYRFITLTDLNTAVKKLKTTKSFDYTMSILNQYPVCINVKHSGIAFAPNTSKHFRTAYITLSQINELKNPNIKIGITKQQVELL